MSGKTLFKNLVAELEAVGERAFAKHSKDALKKQEALVQYKRLQYIRLGKQLSPDEDKKLVESVRIEMNKPAIDTKLLDHLNKESLNKAEKDHLQNIVTFVNSQRTYVELLERYNPGISMKQTDKVRKTARRVGLEIPE
ncbi:unnamed protein product [Ambrosiozyma monospora]|uniref:Unnamed protein product n=1 Tax=Ambrosiozyma monospora TaxID=43982 RepID=A0A9W6YV54_AMBMO|nr:unnamed protein product [Ambrosiozyma monospora]